VLALIPLLPFLGFVANAALGRQLPRRGSGLVANAAVLGSFLLSLAAALTLAGRPPESRVVEQHVFSWISSGEFEAPLTLRLDPLSLVMILIITGIGSLIHVYSTAYMHEERDSEYARYFSYLNLFVAFMLLLVLGANFLVMFVGWEGVGLCSYLLIGFWYVKESASDAGKKAFVVNRIGDFGFVLGILLVFVRFGTIDFREVAEHARMFAPEAAFGTISAITLLLFIGATGKSAQIPLYIWLPDAMEGPTPVSALIHAATMVTAGVYMIGRNAALFAHAPQTLAIVGIVGASTAFLAGTIGLVQNDIKRVLAYSTVSQLGYMFLAMGVGAYAAGIFHLYTHAFFKGLLFLGAGAVIHALGGEQDVRRMGGLRRDLPITYWTFLVGALAIAGVPLLSGFFSNDQILFRAYATGHIWLWLVGLVTSLLTAVYMFRLVFLAFHGNRSRDAPAHHLHDAPPAMSVALVVLAVGSILAGYVGLPAALGGSAAFERFLEPGLETGATDHLVDATAPLELGLMGISTAVALAGIGVAFYFFLKDRTAADRLADRFVGLRRVLLNKYYVDEVYDAAIVQPIRIVSEDGLLKAVDQPAIDGAANGVASSVGGLGEALRRWQTGSVRAYAASLVLGVVLVIGYYLWR